MSLPQLLSKEEKLAKVRSELESNPNFRVIQQVLYTENPRGLPNLKTQSFILFEDKSDNSYKVAKTSNSNIEIMSIDEFKKFDTSVFFPDSVRAYNDLRSFAATLQQVSSMMVGKTMMTDANLMNKDDIANIIKKFDSDKSKKNNKP